MPGAQVDILMYHSISDASGPTNIAPGIFAAQMDEIARSGIPVTTLDAFLDAKAGRSHLPPRSIIITFDDGFQDFADRAWPVLSRHGFPVINYLPSRHVGGHDAWEQGTPRPIMTWATAKSLQAEGAAFGSHSVSHPRLTGLTASALDHELTASRETIENHLQVPIRHFAPPYGAVNAQVLDRIAAQYQSSVGTALTSASADASPHNLPRIEMFYFRDLARWRAFLGGDDRYLRLRRAMRAIGKLRLIGQ